MNTHRYILQPYSGIASRYECPQCHTPHKFARYIDTATGKQLNPAVGRCERVQNCGYHYKPAQYFADLRRLGIPVPAASVLPSPLRLDKNAPFTIPADLIISAYPQATPGNTALLQFIQTALRPDPAQLKEIIQAYQLRATTYNRIIFPQIDQSGKYRTAKIMAYDPRTGHRLKNRPGSFNWLHRILLKSGRLPADFRLSQCFFGEHLTALNPSKPIGIVESEKTALICSLVYPQYLWLASGGKCNFTADRFRPLVNRIIYAIPDAGALRDWVIKARAISRQLSCQIRVSDCVQYSATLADIANGIDLADLILRGQIPKSF